MSSSASRLWPAAAFVGRAALWPFRVAAARATMNALARMDRRELADIGLTHSGLRDASALALDRDPTALFARRARERRRGAHAPPTAPLDGGPGFADGPTARPIAGPTRLERAAKKWRPVFRETRAMTKG